MFCPMNTILAECLSDHAGHLCKACTLHELGEAWQDLAARTSAGLTRNVYYRRQADLRAANELANRGKARGTSRFE